MAETERRELVHRLLAERKSKGSVTSQSPGSSDSKAQRYQRIQKLLGERRAKLELEGCSDGESQHELLSPGSVQGSFAAAQHSMMQLEGSWTPLESTPGGPCLEYSFDDPGHFAPSLPPSGVASSNRKSSSRNLGASKATGRQESAGQGVKAGSALASMAGALLSPTSTVAGDAFRDQLETFTEQFVSQPCHEAVPSASACRQLEWDHKSSPCRSDSASSTQQRSRAASAEAGSLAISGNVRSAPAAGPEQSALHAEDADADDELAQSDADSIDHCREHQHAEALCRSGSLLSGVSQAEGPLNEKLLEALRDSREGPVELDTAMLYSPASSTLPRSEASLGESCRAAKPGAHGYSGIAGDLSIPAWRGARDAAAGNRSDSMQGNNPSGLSGPRAAKAEEILAELRRREGAPLGRRARPRSGSRAGSGSEAGTLVGGARIGRLAQPRTQLWNKCAAKKLQEQNGALAECSFVPITGRGPRSGLRAAAANLPAPVRLYANHSSKYKQWGRLKAEQEQEELQQCTFAPVVNEGGGSDARPPLHCRLEDLQRQRRERLAKLQAAAGASGDSGATFSPAVCERSLRLALTKQIRELHDEVPAYRRLGIACRRLPEPCPGANEDLTFAPVINEASTRLLEDSAQLPGSFFRRQRFFHDLKQQRMRVLQAEIARLAVADKERVESARAAAAHQYYSQFTFQPAINSKSKHLMRGDRLAELTSDDARRARLEVAAAEAEAERDRECTFKPTLSASTLRLSDQENHDPAVESKQERAERAEEAKRRRQAALEEQRSARETQELAECSFAPAKPFKPPPAPKEAVKVAGMERYMRIKQHARQLAEEQRAREKKAFILHPRKTLDPCTVPEPFALQTELRELETAKRRTQLQASILATSMKECTFQPKTNEALNRELLRSILEQEDDGPPESIASASTC